MFTTIHVLVVFRGFSLISGAFFVSELPFEVGRCKTTALARWIPPVYKCPKG